MKEECIFCSIVNGKIPAEKIFESDNFFAIKDIHPKTKGHTLIIPKKHYKNFLEMPSLLFSEFLSITKEATLKIMQREKAEGFNLVMNNFKIAGQVIEHAHLHILPRYSDDNFKINV
ncbi:MAG: HIT family protein [Nanoarchaeota archaeon]